MPRKILTSNYLYKLFLLSEEYEYVNFPNLKILTKAPLIIYGDF